MQAMALKPLDSGASFLNDSQELGSGSPATLAIRELPVPMPPTFPKLVRHLPGTFRGTERSICTTGMCSTPGASW